VHRPWLDNTGTAVLFAESEMNFSLLQRIQTETAFPPSSYPVETAGSFVVAKVAGT
jgi:hypothetical protein